MGDVLDLDHLRRARRLFGIFVGRFGLDHFLARSPDAVPRLDPDRLEQALGLAADWLHRRTERQPEEATLRVMRRDLRRVVLRHLAERLVQAGL